MAFQLSAIAPPLSIKHIKFTNRNKDNFMISQTAGPNKSTTVLPIRVDMSPLLKVKVKVKLSLCLNKHHAMKVYWEQWRYSSTHSWPRH
jgi:hypothetical protein